MTDHELLDQPTEQLHLLVVPAAPAVPGSPSPRRATSALPRRRVPARLRLDEDTRRLGMAGVAEARAILAAQAERRLQRELPERTLPARRQAA